MGERVKLTKAQAGLLTILSKWSPLRTGAVSSYLFQQMSTDERAVLRWSVFSACVRSTLNELAEMRLLKKGAERKGSGYLWTITTAGRAALSQSQSDK